MTGLSEKDMDKYWNDTEEQVLKYVEHEERNIVKHLLAQYKAIEGENKG